MANALKREILFSSLKPISSHRVLELRKENYEMALRTNQPDSPVLQELRAAVDTSRTKMQFDSVNFVRYTTFGNTMLRLALSSIDETSV